MKQLSSFMLGVAVLLGSVFFTANNAGARSFVASNTGNSRIYYIRTEGDMLIFDLQLTDLPATGSMIRITDDEQNTLYEERINATAYNKRFKILRSNNSKLHFEVISKKVILKQSFRLQYKVEEKWEVIKA